MSVTHHEEYYAGIKAETDARSRRLAERMAEQRRLHEADPEHVPLYPAPDDDEFPDESFTAGWEDDEPQHDILTKIEAALADAEVQPPEWTSEREDSAGYAHWAGSVDAAEVRFGPRDHGTPDGRPLGFRQARLLRYVLDNPGCSMNAANDGSGSYWAYKGARALERRGMLRIDRGNPRRFALTITPSGERALAAFEG